MKRLAFAAVLLAVGLGAASVAAQKIKPVAPTVRWTLQVIGSDVPGMPTIMGGLGGQDRGAGVIYNPAESAEVTFSAATSAGPYVLNQFTLHLKNANPLAAKTTTDPRRWISFRNIAFQPEGMSFDSVWGPYTSTANNLGPVLQPENTWLWPFRSGAVDPYGQPDYQAAFLNSDSHPRQYYTTVLLVVGYYGPSFVDLPEGVESYVQPSAGLAVWAKRDCTDPLAVEIGIYKDRAERTVVLPEISKDAVVTRLNKDQWRIDVDQPIKLIEYGCYLKTTVQGRKTTTSCTSSSHGGWWTRSIRFSMIVTRIIS